MANKISIVKNEYDKNLNSAKDSVGTLKGSKLTATNLDGTSLGPFTELISLENDISSIIKSYVGAAENDTKQYKNVETKIDKTDVAIGNSFKGGK